MADACFPFEYKNFRRVQIRSDVLAFVIKLWLWEGGHSCVWLFIWKKRAFSSFLINWTFNKLDTNNLSVLNCVSTKTVLQIINPKSIIISSWNNSPIVIHAQMYSHSPEWLSSHLLLLPSAAGGQWHWLPVYWDAEPSPSSPPLSFLTMTEADPQKPFFTSQKQLQQLQSSSVHTFNEIMNNTTKQKSQCCAGRWRHFMTFLTFGSGFVFPLLPAFFSCW